MELPGRFPDWETLYRTTEVEEMPWFSEALDADLERELARREITEGRFLDLGTGPGTQAAALSGRGFEVTGTDLSESAIEKAEKRSDGIVFLVDDILNSKLPEKGFDYVFDRGLFHTIPVEKRREYIRTVRNLLVDDGLLFLKCFSTKEEALTEGPYRFSREELEDLFSQDFSIERMKETVYHGTLDPLPKAWFVAMRKR